MLIKIKKKMISDLRKYQSNHFEKTHNGRLIQKLKDSHKGEKCIVVCNGPSLLPEDLNRIQEKGIPTFGMNRIFKIFNQTIWRPTYYVCEDELIIKGIEKEISTIPAKYKFIPINLKWYHDIYIPNALLFWMGYRSVNQFEYGISLDVAHKVCCNGTVTTTCIQFAIYMGFSEIYLIGCDNNYSRTIDNNGNVVEDKSVKDYFADGYDEDIKKQVVHDMRGVTRAYADLEQFCRKTGKIRIYNATRGGKLEIFQRVNLDDIL